MGICDLNTVISWSLPQSQFSELAMCVRVGGEEAGEDI